MSVSNRPDRETPLSAEELMSFAEETRDPNALRPHVMKLSRLSRTLLELIALSWEEVSPRTLERALPELNVTPRNHRAYPLGDVIAELDDLVARGWLLPSGGAYRCPDPLAHLIIGRLTPQQLKTYRRHVLRLSGSALQQALHAASLTDETSLQLYGLRVGQQLKRDLIFALKQGDESGLFSLLWQVYEPLDLPRFWVTKSLAPLDERTLEALPSALSLWIQAERLMATLGAPHMGPPELLTSSLQAFTQVLSAQAEPLSGPLNEAYGFSLASRELLGGGEALLKTLSASLKREGASRAQGRGALRPLYALAEALGDTLSVVLILKGRPAELPALLKCLEELCAREVRALSPHQTPRATSSQLDVTGRLKLWSCVAALSEGSLSSATQRWQEAGRALNKRQVTSALLGADAPLTRRLSALCLYAIKAPDSLDLLKLPSMIGAQFELEGEPTHPLVEALDALLDALTSPSRGLSQARVRLLHQLLKSSPSPLWDLTCATALAWSGLTEDELSEYGDPLAERVALWAHLDFDPLSLSLHALLPSAPPTALSALQEPEPLWVTRLEELEDLTRALLSAPLSPPSLSPPRVSL